MKKMLKRTMSVITALALLLSMGISSMAMELDFDLPTVTQTSGRFNDFTAKLHDYADAGTKTDGGTITFDAEAADKIASDKGLLVLERFDAEDTGELYWDSYVNSTYGCGNGFVELPITKETADQAVEVYTRGAGYVVALKWDADGKLYGKYRDNFEAGTASSWRYICDIEGLSAKFTLFIFTKRDCYNVAINDKIVACGLYSMTKDSNLSECARVSYAPGSAGKVYVDYKKMGDTYNQHVVFPGGTTVDTTDVANGNLTVNTDFLGITDGFTTTYNLYTALYDLTGELQKINVTPVTSANITMHSYDSIKNCGYVSAAFSVSDINYKELYARTFLWDTGIKPKTDDKYTYLNTVPAEVEIINATNPLRHSSGTEGSDYGNVEFGDNWMKLTRNADTPEGETQYMAQTCYNNGAQYSLITDSVMTFKLKKSRADMGGFFVGLPCDYATLSWDENGNFWSCYRNSAEQDGTTTSWTKLGYSTDALEVTVHVAYNGGTSTWSMWIDGVPVVADKYSRAVYNGAHNVPDKIANVRIYTETGKAGDVFELTDFYMYDAVGYGA